MTLSTNELLHRRWNEALPGDRATRDGVIYQLSEKGEWLYVEDPYDGQSIRAHKDHTIAEAIAAERARIVAGLRKLHADTIDEFVDDMSKWQRIEDAEETLAAALRIVEGGSE